MSTETLEPGEWGPFEELAAASAEILRLRTLLRLRGQDPDDPASVPPGHLVYQPEAADQERGRAHKTVLVEQSGQSAEIDEPIAPLITEVWKAGIRTLHSCQDNPRGYVWIEFESIEDARRFVDRAIGAQQPGRGQLFHVKNRAFREGPVGFWPLSQGLWLYKVLPVNRAEAPATQSDFLLSVRFPHADLPGVLAHLQQHNAPA